jgi:hypothetical protein
VDGSHVQQVSDEIVFCFVRFCVLIIVDVLESVNVKYWSDLLVSCAVTWFNFINLKLTCCFISRLRDPVVEVRYNTLMVVTHLVLNDMIKVKGQVSHVAMSLNDECPLVADLARLFFVKLVSCCLFYVLPRYSKLHPPSIIW